MSVHAVPARSLPQIRVDIWQPSGSAVCVLVNNCEGEGGESSLVAFFFFFFNDLRLPGPSGHIRDVHNFDIVKLFFFSKDFAKYLKLSAPI